MSFLFLGAGLWVCLVVVRVEWHLPRRGRFERDEIIKIIDFPSSVDHVRYDNYVISILSDLYTSLMKSVLSSLEPIHEQFLKSCCERCLKATFFSFFETFQNVGNFSNST